DRVRRVRDASLVLLAAGAGAGLTTAFNAPVGGMLFVFEEILQRFEPRTVIATAAACITAVVFERAIFGVERDFVVAFVPPPATTSLGLFRLLGPLAGLLGALYNRLILGFGSVASALDRWPAGVKGACVGVAVGLLAWFMPTAVGGGDPITQ